jgi:hypothetical protein
VVTIEETLKGLDQETGELVEIGAAHPVADLFPMLTGEEFDELTASIQEQGLLQPITLDTGGRVLDGRNRLAACARLGVIPDVTIYEGEDPDGYALSVNLARRNLSKGQQAMVIARSGVKYLKNTGGPSKQRVSWARQVLGNAPDLVDAVLSGTQPLNDAYKVAQDRKQASKGETARLARLQAEAPDLADQVTDEQSPMTLGQAIGAYQERERERQAMLADGRMAAERITTRYQADVLAIEMATRAGGDLRLTSEMVTACEQATSKLRSLLEGASVDRR